MPGTTEWKASSSPGSQGGPGPLAAQRLEILFKEQQTIALITPMGGGEHRKKSSNGFSKPQELSYYPDTSEEHLPCKRIPHRVPLNIQLGKGR